MRPHEEIAKIFGYDMFRIKRSHMTVSRHLRTLFDFYGVNLVIDVGANQGQYGRALRQAGYKGRIVSFEPVSSTYKVLVECAGKDCDWQTYQYALGSSSGKQQINVTRFSDLASFHLPNQYAESAFAENIEIAATEEVQVMTLDQLFDDLVVGIDNPCVFLKMDTQGHDLEVLSGAEGSLGKIMGLQSEVAVIPIYEDIPDYVESLMEYRKRGYEVTGLYPVSRDGESLVVIEFDCVMVKRST